MAYRLQIFDYAEMFVEPIQRSADVSGKELEERVMKAKTVGIEHTMITEGGMNMEFRKVFDTIPEQFDKYRPRYSAELFADL